MKVSKDGTSTTSGVDYARSILPGKHLPDTEFEVEIRQDPFTDTQKNWDELTKYWDVILTSYIDSPWGYVSMGFNAEKNGCEVIIDLDDNVWVLPPSNPVYKNYHKGTEALETLTSILHHCKYVTTTNGCLANGIAKYANKNRGSIKVFPNYIDLEAYKFENIVPKPHDTINITHFGSSTHWQDLTEGGFIKGLKMIVDKYPQVRVKTVGNWIPEFVTMLGPKYVQGQGNPDVYGWIEKTWPELMGETDICVAPLNDTESNRGKSDIKLLECGAAKKPVVCSDTRPYHDTVGLSETIAYLANTPEQWFDRLEKLILSEELRKQRGETLYQYVKDNRTIQSNIDKMAEWIKSIVDK
jgi:glycosyltransferase involved in cell wall biosynthesis